MAGTSRRNMSSQILAFAMFALIMLCAPVHCLEGTHPTTAWRPKKDIKVDPLPAIPPPPPPAPNATSSDDTDVPPSGGVWKMENMNRTGSQNETVPDISQNITKQGNASAAVTTAPKASNSTSGAVADVLANGIEMEFENGPAVGNCSALSTCGECGGFDNCGWCDSSKKCMEGEKKGPKGDAKCEAWHVSPVR